MARETLVVCYSRSGVTRRVGEHLARQLDAELDLIEDAEPRAGVLGFVRSSFESLARGVPLIRTVHDPADFARVVLGSPVWAFSVSAPVRSYLLTHGRALRVAGLFTVMGGMGGEQAVREMRLGARAPDAASCILRERDVLRGDLVRLCEPFVKALQSREQADAALAGRAA